MTDQALRRARKTATPPAVGAKLSRATVLSWSSGAGFAISLGGTKVTSFDVLELGFIPNPGDIVSVLRYKTTILVLGIVEDPGDQDVAQLGGSTVTAASLSTIASDTVEAGAVPGAVYEFEAWGNGTQTVGNRQTLKVGVALGGNDMSATTFGTTAFSSSDSAFRWTAKVRVVCQSAGASGTWTSYVLATVSDFSGNIAPGNNNESTGTSCENTGTTTVDTTNDATMALRMAWGSTSGSPSVSTQVRLPIKRIA
jgi:hypothetical protein